MKIEMQWNRQDLYDGGRKSTITFGRKKHIFRAQYVTCGTSVLMGNPENRKVHRWKETLTEEELCEIFKEGFNQLCNNGKHSRKSFLVFTNTIHGGEEFNKILDRICQHSSEESVNANTGNKIRTWIFKKD